MYIYITPVQIWNVALPFGASASLASSACSLVCDAVDQVEMSAEERGHAAHLRGVAAAQCISPSISQIYSA